MLHYQMKHREIKRVENTPCSGVFLTKFEFFHLVVKRYVEARKGLVGVNVKGLESVFT